MNGPSTRREFIEASSALVGSAWLAVHWPAIEAAARHARRALAQRAPFEILTPDEARALEAVAAQIIPTDDTPGAREAGVIYFMDRALGSFGAQFLQPIREGLPDLVKAARATNPAARGFAELSPKQQAEVLRSMEQTPFFGAVRFLTVAGMFGDPSYGGNRDRVGWQMIGFDGGHAHQPPFGYYDANARPE